MATQEIFWNPLTGDNANAGTLASPVQTRSRVQTLLDAVSSSDNAIIRLKTEGMSFAQMMALDWFDGQLDFGSTRTGRVTFTGWGDDKQIVPTYKLLTSWATTPSYSNVYKTTDATESCRAYEVPDTDSPLDLQAFTLVTGASWAAVAATVQANAGRYWIGADPENSNATTLFIHPFGSTNPITDGKTYVRTKALSGSWDEVSWVRMNAAESVLLNLAFSGSGMRQNTGTNLSGHYFARVRETARYARIERCEFWHTQDHLFGVNHGNTTCQNQLTEIIGVEFGRCVSVGPFIAYSGASDSTGNLIRVINCTCTEPLEVAGQITGTTNSGCLYGHNTNSSGYVERQFSMDVEGGSYAGMVLQIAGTGGQHLWDRLSFRHIATLDGYIATNVPNTIVEGCSGLRGIPYPTHTGAGVFVRSTHMKAKATHNPFVASALKLQGTVNLRDCTLDGSELNSTIGDTYWFTRTATLAMSMYRCNVDMRAGLSGHMLRLGYGWENGEYTGDYNRFRSRLSNDPIGNYGPTTSLNFTDWKSTTGQDANSTQTVNNSTADWVQTTLGLPDPVYKQSEYVQPTIPDESAVRVGDRFGYGGVSGIGTLIEDPRMREDFATESAFTLSGSQQDAITITPTKVAEKVFVTIKASDANTSKVSVALWGKRSTLQAETLIGDTSCVLTPGEVRNICVPMEDGKGWRRSLILKAQLVDSEQAGTIEVAAFC